MIVKFPDDVMVVDDSFPLQEVKEVAFDLYFAQHTEVLGEESQILEIRAWLHRN